MNKKVLPSHTHTILHN